MKPTSKLLQELLADLYRIDIHAKVSDFMVDRESVRALYGDAADEKREMLLVLEHQEETLLGVFLSQEVVISAKSFLNYGHAKHLDCFCVMLEGISHFMYLTYAGGQDRPVSQAELELQAEIDKFVFLHTLVPYSGNAEGLVKTLFEYFDLDASLNQEEQARYLLANRLSRRYARWFFRTWRNGGAPRALEDARRLYRKSMTRKLAHIARAA